MSIGSRLREQVTTELYRFQIRGVRFVEACEGRALITDDMGLGKTIQSLGWAAIHPEARPVVIVCPSSLKYTWQRELKKHANISSYICDKGVPTIQELDARLRKRLSDLRKRKLSPLRKHRLAIKAARQATKRRKEEVRQKIREAKKHDFLICNYEILWDWIPVFDTMSPQLLIIDECHYVSNRKAKRTKACKLLSKWVKYVIALSGTPIAGKPGQFFPVLQMVRPKEFRSWLSYAMEYCDPKKGWKGRMEFTGASNLEALHERLQDIMIRRMKHEVLKELPTKQRTIIPLDITNRVEYEKAENDFLLWLAGVKDKDAVKRAARAEAICRLNSLKILAAQGILSHAVKWIQDWLASSDQKLLVFGIHKVILKVLKKAFPDAAVVDGSVKGKKRQKEVDRFQEDPKSRLFLGHLKAAGHGLTLTAASNVVFVELGWGPGEHNQAEDRALRIGQTENVDVYYLVGKNTVAETLLGFIEEKDGVCAQVLDGKQSGGMALLQAFLSAVDRPTYKIVPLKRKMVRVRMK